MTIAYHLVVPIMGTLPSDVVRSLLREATNGYSPVGLPCMAWHTSCSRCGTFMLAFHTYVILHQLSPSEVV
ncbi:Protein fluG [Fusarium oxysporum f. sp. albedinis]|nr:Protein fluG [Fusarium oxysporum f. sp. albedinis]